MIFGPAAAWDLVTTVVLLVAVVYSSRIYVTFRGGDLSRAYSLVLWAFCVLFVAFLLKFSFDLVNFKPIDVYDISVRDAGMLVAIVLLTASLRELTRFWRVQPLGARSGHRTA